MIISSKVFKISIFTLKLLHILLASYVVYKMHIPLLHSLIFVFLLSFVVVYDPLLKPLVLHQQKRVEKDQKILNKHIKIAEKSNKKAFPFGKEKQHTVWARNHFEAKKLYELKIAPKALKDSNTIFYYISEACNNVNN